MITINNLNIRKEATFCKIKHQKIFVLKIRVVIEATDCFKDAVSSNTNL